MRNELSLFNRSWDPFREFNQLQRGMNSLFDELIGGRPASVAPRGFTPTCDVAETENHFMISLDIPGIEKKDLKVEVNDGQLTISGERKHEEIDEDKGSYHRVERSYGRFERTFMLPTTVEANKIEAQYKEGVLRVALPKKEAAKPREITIEAKPSGFFDRLVGKTGPKVADTKDAA